MKRKRLSNARKWSMKRNWALARLHAAKTAIRYAQMAVNVPSVDTYAKECVMALDKMIAKLEAYDSYEFYTSIREAETYGKPHA